jgi:hypothetical protein
MEKAVRARTNAGAHSHSHLHGHGHHHGHERHSFSVSTPENLDTKRIKLKELRRQKARAKFMMAAISIIAGIAMGFLAFMYGS